MSNAHDVAMSAYKLALQAARNEQAEKDRKTAAEKAVREAQSKERIDNKLKLALPILDSWFPGSGWKVLDDGEGHYYSELVLIEQSASPNSKLKIAVEPVLLNETQPIKVRLRCVKQVVRNSYLHWDGPEVKSAADVGRWLQNG